MCIGQLCGLPNCIVCQGDVGSTLSFLSGIASFSFYWARHKLLLAGVFLMALFSFKKSEMKGGKHGFIKR